MSSMSPTTSETTSQKRFKLPSWAGAAAAIGCLLIGGGFIYWFLFGSMPSSRKVVVDPSQVVPDRGTGTIYRRAPEPAQRIRRTGDAQWTIETITGAAFIENNSDGSYRFLYTASSIDRLGL